MPYGIDRMVQYHPGPRIAHHPPYGLAHRRTVAVHRALAACALGVASRRTTVKACVRVA